MKKIFNTSDHLIPERLDKLITSITGMSRNKIQNLIKSSNVKINGRVETSPKFNVDIESEIEIEFEIDETTTIIPKKMEIDIVYEDEDFAVINKQSGLTVHPGAGNYQDTLVNGLLYYFKENLSDVNSFERPGIVHRLDRDTSGLMVIAKNNDSHNSLAKQIELKSARRSYLALVWGFLKESNGIIDKNLARSSSDRTKMTTVQLGGKTAVTHYKTLEIFKNGLISLVECTLETGRTHQIRVHMSQSGHSIVGDNTYGSNAKKIKQIIDPELKESIQAMNRQALHAYKLSFTHPRTSKLMEFESEIPEDISQTINFLRKK